MNNKKRTNGEFLNELKSIHSNNIFALEDYIGTDTKIKFKCNICNHQWNTTPYLLLKGSGCPCCAGRVCVENINSVYKLRPDLIKYFKSIEDTKEHTVKSADKVECICPKCGYIKKTAISNLSNNGFHCDYCNDKISIPNKFTANLLKQLCVAYELEKTFKWSQKKRYDVYISSHNNKKIIIENQGIQHKNGGFEDIGGRNLNEEQENDILKKNLALENKIDKYIEIYYYNHYNTLESCKQSILNSELNNIFDLSNINWNDIWEECQKSLILQVWKTWSTMDKNIRSTVSLGKIYGLGRTTIARYLKLGVSIGKVEYYPLEEQKTFKGRYGDKHPNSKKVICLNTEVIYSSLREALKIHKGDIQACCNGKIKSSGVSEDGTKLVWRYYKDYINMTNDEIKYCIKIANTKVINRPYKIIDYKRITLKKVVCLNTGEIFLNFKEVSEKYEIKQRDNIEKCCKGNNEKWFKSCGISKEGEKLVWRYYDEYILLSKDEIDRIIKEANNLKKGSNHYKSKDILCINTNKVFGNQRDAANCYNIKSYNNIGMCCRGERKYCGTLPNGEKLMWKYLNDD